MKGNSYNNYSYDGNQHASTAHLIFQQQILYGTVRERFIERLEKTHFSEFSWGLTSHVATAKKLEVKEGICEFGLDGSFECLRVTGHNLAGTGSQGFVFNLETENETFTFNSQSKGSKSPAQ